MTRQRSIKRRLESELDSQAGTSARAALPMGDQSGRALTSKQRALIMMPLVVGGFLAVANETLLNVAFPELMSDLHVSTTTIQWLASAYMLVIAIMVPVVAFLLKTFSTRTLYFSAMLLFTIGTVSCGLSQSFPALLASRMLQGAGTGMLIPMMTNTVFELYPPARRGAALGISMMVVVLAPAIAPTLSGIALQHLSWHWLFFLVLPFAILATGLGHLTLQNVTVLTKPPIDILSIVLSSVGLGGLIFGIVSVETLGLGSVTVLIALLLGIGGLVLFSRRQLALEQPMLELRTFRYPMFALGTAIVFIAFMIPFAVNIILPTYMQSALGITPFIAGLALVPGSVLGALIPPLSGRLYDKVGARPLVVCGFAALTVATLLLSRTSLATTLAALSALQAFMMGGIAFIATPTQTNSLNQLPADYGAHGVAILNTVLQVAAAFGSSVFIGLMGSTQTKYLDGFENPGVLLEHAAIVRGVDVAFTAALIMVAVGLGLSLFLRRREPGECELSFASEG